MKRRLKTALLYIVWNLGLIYGLDQMMLYTEVGFSGHVSEIDKRMARERRLRHLTRFERWVLKPVIEIEREQRRKAWREACKEVLGE